MLRQPKQAAFTWLMVGLVAAAGCTALVAMQPKDQNGIEVYIDNDTGCHYITANHGGVTPRLDRQNKPICESYETTN